MNKCYDFFRKIMELKELNIVCFDGICGICNKWIDFLIRIDEKKVLHYTPIQNEAIAPFLVQFGIDPKKLDTVVYIKQGEVFLKSDAVLKIIESLDWNTWLLPLLRVYPRSFRNYVYDIIAKNRYKIMKPKPSCRIPTPEEEDLFL